MAGEAGWSVRWIEAWRYRLGSEWRVEARSARDATDRRVFNSAHFNVVTRAVE